MLYGRHKNQTRLEVKEGNSSLISYADSDGTWAKEREKKYKGKNPQA